MIEVMDTTLRDGEQTAGVSFNADEKLAIARLLLEELKVNRIEAGSARVSSGEKEACTKICSWASTNGYADQVEILGFVDNGASENWIAEVGGRCLNLLTKGSLHHLTGQLRKSPQEHLDDILREIGLARAKGLAVNVYLEDWSNGMADSPEYVFFLVDHLKDAGVRRIMLPDTLGVLNPALGLFHRPCQPRRIPTAGVHHLPKLRSVARPMPPQVLVWEGLAITEFTPPAMPMNVLSKALLVS